MSKDSPLGILRETKPNERSQQNPGEPGTWASTCGTRIDAFVYDELRKLAASQLAKESSDHSLNPTALVHEAYLRLVNNGGPFKWENRGIFSLRGNCDASHPH